MSHSSIGKIHFYIDEIEIHVSSRLSRARPSHSEENMLTETIRARASDSKRPRTRTFLVGGEYYATGPSPDECHKFPASLHKYIYNYLSYVTESLMRTKVRSEIPPASIVPSNFSPADKVLRRDLEILRASHARLSFSSRDHIVVRVVADIFPERQSSRESDTRESAAKHRWGKVNFDTHPSRCLRTRSRMRVFLLKWK